MLFFVCDVKSLVFCQLRYDIYLICYEIIPLIFFFFCSLQDSQLLRLLSWSNLELLFGPVVEGTLLLCLS